MTDAQGPDRGRLARHGLRRDRPRAGPDLRRGPAQRRREGRAGRGGPRRARRDRRRRPPSQFPTFAAMLASPVACRRPTRIGSSSTAFEGRALPTGRPVPPGAQPPRPARPARRRSPARPGRSGTAGRTAARCTVRSAVPLDDAQQAALRDRLGRHARRHARPHARGRPRPDRRPGRPGRRRRLRRLGPQPPRTAPPPTDRRKDA